MGSAPGRLLLPIATILAGSSALSSSVDRWHAFFKMQLPPPCHSSVDDARVCSSVVPTGKCVRLLREHGVLWQLESSSEVVFYEST